MELSQNVETGNHGDSLNEFRTLRRVGDRDFSAGFVLALIHSYMKISHAGLDVRIFTEIFNGTLNTPLGALTALCSRHSQLQLLRFEPDRATRSSGARDSQ